MLSDLVRIVYRHPDKTPIQLLIEGNLLTIDCSFHYNRKALQPLADGSGILADQIEDGIRKAWEGLYRLDWPGLTEAENEDETAITGNDDIRIRIVFHRDGQRRMARIGLQRLFFMPAHVISPLWRRLWGVCKTGQLESLGTNWSLENPGRMVLPTGLDSDQLGRIAAHEAGHLFGLGDAYGAIYRFYDGVPGKEQYMMYSNHRVHAEEIEMLLRAHLFGRMQFFPRRWNGRNFIRGLKKDLKARAAQLERQIAAWRRDRKGQRNQ